MPAIEENITVTKRELDELLTLKGWSKRQLAREIKVSEDLVYRWFNDRWPRGPAEVAVRLMLTEARRKSRRLVAS